VLLVLCYAVHLGSTENINKRFPGALSSCYFCQNEILYNERVNGLLSKFFSLIFYRHLSFVFTVRQKIFPPCNSKTLYIMFTDSRQESLEPTVRDEISFLLGDKKVFLNWFERTLPPHATHCLASGLKVHKHETFFLTFFAETESIWSQGPVTRDF
jgi:hypothetical protein